MSDMKVVRTFMRKMKSTIATQIPPSRSDWRMLPIELLIKSLCRKVSVEIFRSLGRVFFISSRAATTLSVIVLVSALGCLVTVSSTAGLAFSEARPSFGDLVPSCTPATSESSTVPRSSERTTVLAMSVRLVVLMFPLMIYSLPYS